MRSIHAAALTGLLAAATLATVEASDSQAEGKMCWSTIVAPSDARNFLLVCLGKERVSLMTYFANPGAEPTICRQLGSIVSQTTKTIVIESENGTCENTMVMGGSVYECSYVTEDKIACLVDGQTTMTLRREAPELYSPNYRPTTT